MESAQAAAGERPVSGSEITGVEVTALAIP
ncbi:MAG: hypothetical protein JWR07_3449 [Nevskia sp.]|nr:hypothetical protein [Nevskia sp.]